MGVHERRRLVLATAFTVVALPTVWLFDRQEAAVSPQSAAIGLPDPVADGAGSSEGLTGPAGVQTSDGFADDDGSGADDPTSPTLVPQVPLFLDNPVLHNQPAVIDIAVPDAPSPTERRALLTFKDYADHVERDGDALCTLPGAPARARITVTNVDNGQWVECTNDLGMAVPVGADMAIDINLYVRLADLVDAPVPVRVSW